MHGPRSRVEMVSLLLALAPVCARAQQIVRASTMPPLELRVDAIDPRSSRSGTLQGGVGVNIPLGYYVRLELVGGAGVTRRDTVDHASGRVDALGRFLLDPFGESPWGLSIGGGMSVVFAGGARTHEYLVVVTDLEGPPVGPLVPALQVGLGGGVRAGVVLRGYHSGRR
jgi:hypothetical protein